MLRRQLSEASKKQRRDKMAFKKRGRLSELPEELINEIYRFVFVPDGTVSPLLSANKALREMLMPCINLHFKPWITAAKAACFDAVRERRKLQAVEAAIIEEALTSGFDPAPDGQTPIMATMAIAVQEARAQETEAENELKTKLKIKYEWWQPRL